MLEALPSSILLNVEPSPQNHLPGAEVKRCIIRVHRPANSTAPRHERWRGPGPDLGEGVLTGLRGRFCPFHSPLRIHSSLIVKSKHELFFS